MFAAQARLPFRPVKIGGGLYGVGGAPKAPPNSICDISPGGGGITYTPLKWPSHTVGAYVDPFKGGASVSYTKKF